jgi:hypothetical protein
MSSVLIAAIATLSCVANTVVFAAKGAPLVMVVLSVLDVAVSAAITGGCLFMALTARAREDEA